MTMTDDRKIQIEYPWTVQKGSSTSGNFGHSGRKGYWGGSGPGGGHAALGVKPGASKTQLKKAIAKHQKNKGKATVQASKPKSSGFDADTFLKMAPKNQSDFTNHLMSKVQSGEISFGDAQNLQSKFAGSGSSKSAGSTEIKGNVPRGKVYNGLTLDEAPSKWSKWAKGLEKSERDALINYQTEPFDNAPTDYTKINGHLRGKDKRPSKATRAAITQLDKALDKSRIPEDTVVYRGFPASVLGDDPERLVGSTIKDKGYTSTSLSKQVAGQFGKVSTEIRIPKGAKGGLLDSLKSGKDPEYELLLPRNSEFRILAVDKSGGQTNIVMELVQ